ncbi:DNA cytosine methyltransferase [Herbaspirillum sp. YR522]|uniref:DNA cytosine methyltransferase n=1 Tax=Herbaspirillum sp. YR522 TaxID=1144342 RepID=UPI00026FA28E|nr:DNA cytosine methyltransferase [Herbaspirillum sp. YR522]EJN06448.1 site-specific DNA methylase [Herbaspirillum sp. YR522]
MKRDNHTLPLGIAAELLIDNFAGGGGASTGIEMAFGRPVDVAINHDGEALAMHAANHPGTAHYEEDVFTVHPGFVTRQQPIGLAWFSPDCKHHSKAKGGKPREKKIRGLAWVCLKWATFQMPRAIAIENVEEFQDWGPLDDEGKPIKAEKGRTFRAFVDALSTGLAADHPDLAEIYDALGADFPMERLHAGLGYKVECRILRACDYGTPTIRKRLFIFARRDGLPIVWPAPTHGDPKSDAVKQGKLLPYRTAAECIDWSIPCPSIFERKKPLKEATLRRIAKGIMKFVVNSADPFIVSTAHSTTTGRGPNVWPMDEPLRTTTSSNDKYLIVPSVMHTTHQGADRNADVTEPLATVTGANRGEQAMVSAHITKFRTGSTGSPLDEPLHTVTAGGDSKRPAGAAHAMGIVEATLAPFITEHANASTQRNMPADEPLRTQCAEVKGGHFAAVSATLVQTGYGERPGQAPRAPGLDKPLGTVVAGGGKHALVTATLVDAAHGEESPSGVKRWGVGAHDIEKPVGTVTASGGNQALVSAMLAKHYGGVTGTRADVPFGTVTTSDHHSVVTAQIVGVGGRAGQSRPRDASEPIQTVTAKADSAVVTSHLVKLRNNQFGQSVEEPAPTLTAGGGHVGEVRAFLIKYYGADKDGVSLAAPLGTVPTHDRFGLVTIQGEEYEIVDIGMRMLTPRELARAQGFPDSYILDPVVNGKPLSKTAQVRMIGNSVCPPLARAILEANFQHEREIARVA